jgi:asparagine synthase (glutamine-hydrolysing)
MGRNNSVSNRFGPFVTPLIDAGLAAAALRVPLRFKRFGLFEAALIRAAHPRLASLPSAYGHDFARPPGLAHRLTELGALVRPTWLRSRTHVIKRALGGRAPAPATPPMLDPALPIMRRYVRLERVTDEAQLRRVWTLEYLFAHVGARDD